jgi:hypothetical protein
MQDDSEVEEEPRYSIKRFYHPDLDRRNRIIKRGLTLEEAQEHCSDPKTAKEGVYFDGYEKQSTNI